MHWVRPALHVGFVQGVGDHQDLGVAQRLLGKRHRRSLNDVAIAPQQVGERRVAAVDGVEVVVRPVDQDERPGSLAKRRVFDGRPEIAIGNLLGEGVRGHTKDQQDNQRTDNHVYSIVIVRT